MSATQSSKVVVITGANRGIGLEYIRQYAAEDNTFVIAIVRSKATSNTLDSFVATGRVAVVEADMTKPETFEPAAAEITKLANKVDILINNAGGWYGAGSKPTKDMTLSTPEEWADSYLLNTIGPIFFTKALLPLLAKGEKKQVVNVSSFLGQPGFHQATDGGFGYNSYSVAKGALNFANLKYHLQYKDDGYTFITLNPGYVQTDLTKTQESAAPLTVDVSVSRMKSFIDRLTTAESGGDYSLDGSKEPLVY